MPTEPDPARPGLGPDDAADPGFWTAIAAYNVGLGPRKEDSTLADPELPDTDPAARAATSHAAKAGTSST